MKIPCKEIALHLEKHLAFQVAELNKINIHPKLVTILVGSAPEQLSFVNIKKRIGEKIGVEFELVHLINEPNFEDFKKIVKEKAEDPFTTGIIIQHPFPSSYIKDEIYGLIPTNKEIEGHRPDSSFHFPLSLAVLNGIKFIIKFKENSSDPQELFVNFEADKDLFNKFLSDKKIVIAGRGITGGAPIADALDEINVSYSQINSETENTLDVYRAADIIITATGKHILTSGMIKDGAILLNVGLRKENGRLQGDYDESDIAGKASFYTQTPGGLGPLDVLYLFKNVIDAATV